MKENVKLNMDNGRVIHVIVNLIAITISIIALCISAYRSPDLGFDYQGVIMAILSFLVVMLIGWDIYKVVSIDNKIDNSIRESEENINSKINDHRKNIDDRINKINKEQEQWIRCELEGVKAAININMGLTKRDKGDLPEAFITLCGALRSAVCAKNKDLYTLIIEFIDEIISKMKSDNIKPDFTNEEIGFLMVSICVLKDIVPIKTLEYMNFIKENKAVDDEIEKGISNGK